MILKISCDVTVMQISCDVSRKLRELKNKFKILLVVSRILLRGNVVKKNILFIKLFDDDVPFNTSNSKHKECMTCSANVRYTLVNEEKTC